MGDGFGEAVLALWVFLLTHGVAGMPGLRARLVAAFGKGRYQILYSLLSLGLLVWLIIAVQRAPYVELWPPQPWAAHLLVGIMPVVTILWTATVTEPNPLSLSFCRDPLNPLGVGLPALIRHPLFLGLAIWAGGHLLANGDVAGALLFGPMLVLSLFGPWMARRKVTRRYGDGQVQRWERAYLNSPLRRSLPRLRTWILGLMLYFGLLGLHGTLFGVDPVALVR